VPAKRYECPSIFSNFPKYFALSKVNKFEKFKSLSQKAPDHLRKAFKLPQLASKISSFFLSF